MIQWVNQFIKISKENWISRALNLTIDFFGNKISRNLIASSQIPQTPVDLKNKKILFIESVGFHDGWWFGDGIFRTPIIEWLWRESVLHILTREWRSLIFDNNPNVKKLHSLWDDGMIGSIVELMSALKKEQFDLIVALHPSWKMHLFMLLARTNSCSLHFSNIGMEEHNTTNLIHLFLSKVRASLWYPHTTTTPSPTLYPTHISENLATNFHPSKRYIGLNVGAKSWLRHFRKWQEVFKNLKSQIIIPKDIVFVLVWRDWVNWVDEKIANTLDPKNVLNFCNKVTLAETYQIISYCKTAFIGMDWWNVNAAIALRHATKARVIPIYNAVNPELRIPSDLPTEDCFHIPCPEWTNCFPKNSAFSCTITHQAADDNKSTPPCLQDDSIVQWISDYLIEIIKKSHSNEWDLSIFDGAQEETWTLTPRGNGF